MARVRGKAQLPAWSRLAIGEYRRRGFSRREIATVFRCSPGTVANVLQGKGTAYGLFSGERRLTRARAQQHLPGRWQRGSGAASAFTQSPQPPNYLLPRHLATESLHQPELWFAIVSPVSVGESAGALYLACSFAPMEGERGAVMVEFEKIAGRFTLIIPVVHLVTCGLYMAGYSLGFGGNIGGLFAASDFFTITIQHLISTYVLGLIAPVFYILLRHRSGKTYAADLIAAEQGDSKKADLIRTRNFVVTVLTWFLPIFALLICILVATQIYVGSWIEYYFTLNMIVLGLVPTWWKLATKLRFYGLPVEITWCFVSFVVGVIGLGLNSGERDRRLQYEAFYSGAMHCSQHVILRPIGERFISVTPDNQRHIIGDDCKVRFDFKPAEPIAEGSLFQLVRAKWEGAHSKVPTPKPTPNAAASGPAPASILANTASTH